MNILVLSASIIGNKTKNIALDVYDKIITDKIDKVRYINYISLMNNKMEFCDGRNWWDYNDDLTSIINNIINADAVIICTPIYQASIPGVFKNLLDILPEHALKNKAVGIIGVAGTSKHHLVIEYQLKPILSFMKAKTIDKYVFIDRGENLDLEERIDKLINDVIEGR